MMDLSIMPLDITNIEYTGNVDLQNVTGPTTASWSMGPGTAGVAGPGAVPPGLGPMMGINHVELIGSAINSADGIGKNITEELLANLAQQEDMEREMVAKFQETFYTYTEVKSIALICLYVPIFVIAFMGNVLVLLVVIPNKHMRSVTNCFIVNLAISDLLVTLICIPVEIGRSIYSLWVYGEVMCKMAGYMQGVCVASSVFTIMCLSVDRYLAIRHPVTFRTFAQGKYTLKITFCIWILALIIMVPLLVVSRVKKDKIVEELDIVFRKCIETWPHESRAIYDVFLLVIMFVIPGCFVTISYSRIGCHLWTEGQQLYKHEHEVCKIQGEKIMLQRRKVARMLVVLAIMFAVCWMPYQLLNLYIEFVPVKEAETGTDVLKFALLLGHTNSALNPILYCFMNKTFRRYVFRLVRWPRKKRTLHRQESPVNLVVCYNKFNNTMRATANASSGRRRITRQGSGTTTTSASGRFSRSSNPNALAGVQTRFSAHRNSVPSLRISTNEPELNRAYTTYTPRRDPLGSRAIGDLSPDIKDPHPADEGPYRGLSRDRREMFNYKLSIPTTINEESSSRTHHSPSPCCDRPSMLQAAAMAELAAENSDLDQITTEFQKYLASLSSEHHKKKRKKKRRLSAEDNSVSESRSSRGRSVSSVSGDSSVSLVCRCQTCRCAALQAKAAETQGATSTSSALDSDGSGRAGGAELSVSLECDDYAELEHSSGEVKPLVYQQLDGDDDGASTSA